MSLLDVETTAEALQEDEELIEAVETFVGDAAESITTEIMTDIETLWRSTIEWLEWLFPLWVAYRDDRAKFWEEIHKLAISALVLAVSFFLLAPSNSRNTTMMMNQTRRRTLLESTRHSFRHTPNFLRRNSVTSTNGQATTIQIKPSPSADSHLQLHQQSLPTPSSLLGVSRRHASICSGRVIVEEEETDAQRFEKNYQTINMSRYRRLLLPPECKRVEKPKRLAPKKATATATASTSTSSATTSSNAKKKKRRKKRDRDSDEDHPARRLRIYANNVLALVKSFMTYDYMGAGMALIRWIVLVLRIRQIRRSKPTADLVEEDDDDDDESKASVSVAGTSSAHSSAGVTQQQQNSQTSLWNPQTPDRSGNDQQQQQQQQQEFICDYSQSSIHTDGSEEKKESLLLPNVGRNSHQSSPPPLTFDADKSSSDNPQSITESTPVQATSESQVIGEPDEEKPSSQRQPLSVTTTKTNASSRRLSIGGKKKDLLQNYRSSLLGGTAPRNSISLTTSMTSQSSITSVSTLDSNATTSNPPLHSNSSGDLTTLHRNHTDENSNWENMSSALDGATPKVDSREDENGSLGDSSSEEPDDPKGRIQRLDSDLSGFFFEAANTHECLQRMSSDAPLPDKHGFIVGDEFLSDSNCTPLLVFVNSRSGPQQGHLLITQLRRLLNPIQVWDLGEDGGPETVLESFSGAFRNLRILVCGGDGTVSWIIAALERLELKRKWPPIAILPLGTGNDLARIHGWGGGYNNESLIGILEDVADSYISLLDQWELSIENRKGKVKEVKSFFNYLGVGADAQAALQVHMLRESRPQLFFSRVVNKAWYGIFGAEDIIKATSLNLPNEITLIADGFEVPLPPDSQGIILLNIDSYSGGAPFWATGGKKDRRRWFDRSSQEVNGGSPNLGGQRAFQPRTLRRTRSLEDLRMGHDQMPRIDSVEDLSQVLTDDHQRWQHVTACLSSAQRLCQCREATIHIKRKVAVQIDGEPWRQNICTLRVKRKPDRAIMLHKSEDKNGVETEVANLLDWAEKRALIDGNVHYAMMKEFSRRIEHKTRQRRHNENNNLFSLKRAIGSTGAIASSYDGNYEYSS